MCLHTNQYDETENIRATNPDGFRSRRSSGSTFRARARSQHTHKNNLCRCHTHQQFSSPLQFISTLVRCVWCHVALVSFVSFYCYYLWLVDWPIYDNNVMTDGSHFVQYTCCCHDTSLAANKIIRSVLWALWGVWRVQRCLLLIAKSLNALTLHTNDVKSYTLRSYTPPTIYSCLWMWMCLIDHLIVRTMCTFNYDSLQEPHNCVVLAPHNMSIQSFSI